MFRFMYVSLLELLYFAGTLNIGGSISPYAPSAVYLAVELVVPQLTEICLSHHNYTVGVTTGQLISSPEHRWTQKWEWV